MKKIAIVMSLVMMIFTFSGFTSAEKAYWDEMKKIYDWQAVESDQDISFELNIPGELAVSYTMDIASKSNMKDLTSYIEIDTKAMGFSPKVPPIKMYTKGSDIYINTSAFVEFSKMAGIPTDKMNFAEEFIMIKSEQQADIDQDLIKELYAFIENLDPKMDTGMKQDGNKFTLDLDSDKMVDLTDAYIRALIENIDKIPMALLQGQPALTENDKQEALQMYNAFVEPYKQIIKDSIKGSTYSDVTVFEDDKYSQKASFDIKTTEGDAKININSVSTKKDQIDIKLPSSVKVMTEADLNELFMPESSFKSISINLDGSYEMYDMNGMSSGMIGIKNINGQTYLKSSDLSTAFGRIFETNEEFIRTTNLETYGIQVYWNAQDRIIELSE